MLLQEKSTSPAFLEVTSPNLPAQVPDLQWEIRCSILSSSLFTTQILPFSLAHSSRAWWGSHEKAITLSDKLLYWICCCQHFWHQKILCLSLIYGLCGGFLRVSFSGHTLAPWVANEIWVRGSHLSEYRTLALNRKSWDPSVAKFPERFSQQKCSHSWPLMCFWHFQPLPLTPLGEAFDPFGSLQGPQSIRGVARQVLTLNQLLRESLVFLDFRRETSVSDFSTFWYWICDSWPFAFPSHTNMYTYQEVVKCTVRNLGVQSKLGR